MNGREDRLPVATPAGSAEVEATQGGEALSTRWTWVEPSVWTTRMLVALQDGVKGGCWYSLMDKVWSRRNLRRSFEKVKARKGAAGADHVTVEEFERRSEEQLGRLERQLRDGSYAPQAVRRVYIPKPGSHEKRPLGIPTVRDRVVQGAVRHVLEPIFERDFAEGSYGFRPGRGCKDALRRVERLLAAGHTWVVDADLRRYFDTIPHEKLMERIRAKVTDGRILDLIKAFLKQGVLDGMETWTPEEGTPQGAVLSPLLANLYLDPLDHVMAEAGIEMVRYADDFVLLCRSPEEAQHALDIARRWVTEAGLTLHPEKTRIVDAMQKGGGFDFLGYHFERAMRWPRTKSLDKLKDAVRAKTHRANGHSMAQIVADLNRTLRGWFEYFKHSHWTTFRSLDGWIRMRLRSILRKRHKLRGRGRGADHQRWPNAHFTDLGLFSLDRALASVRQSARR
jgi:RNA-directed DNA polymerase